MTAWTPKDVILLRLYARRGRSIAATAKLLNRSPPAVAIRASHLGIKFHGGPGGAPPGNNNRRIGMRRKLGV